MKFSTFSFGIVASIWSASDGFQSIVAPRHATRVASFSSSGTQLYASQITMPALSSTMKEGRVVSWLKNEGDEISAGEAIMVVESDKADMDVEAFEDGYLAKIVVAEGEMAPVGQAVALIAESEADIPNVIASFGGAGGAAPAAAVAEGKNSNVPTCKCFAVLFGSKISLIVSSLRTHPILNSRSGCDCRETRFRIQSN
jgi:pyruvate/2-oxoglutarate dehydrogenase complex dihydrolipoamide acyltransferase (E2) component